MKPEIKTLALRRLLAVLAVLGVGIGLATAGMNPAAAAGVAGVSVAAFEGSTRRRAGRCARSRS